MGDQVEHNAIHEKIRLLRITKWYLGRLRDAISLYEEGHRYSFNTRGTVEVIGL